MGSDHTSCYDICGLVSLSYSLLDGEWVNLWPCPKFEISICIIYFTIDIAKDISGIITYLWVELFSFRPKLMARTFCMHCFCAQSTRHGQWITFLLKFAISNPMQSISSCIYLSHFFFSCSHFLCWPSLNLLYPIHLSFVLVPIAKKSVLRLFLSSHPYPNASNEPLNYYDNLSQQFNVQAFVLMSHGLNGKLQMNSQEHIITTFGQTQYILFGLFMSGKI